MIAKRTPSAPPIDLVLSILYVAPYRLPGDDVSGSSVSRPSKPGQVGHVFYSSTIAQTLRSESRCSTFHATKPKTDRSATNWLAVGNSLSQISCQPQFKGASQWDTSLVLNSLESKRAGHRLQSGSLADHNCVALGIMRGKIVAPCRLAGEETEQSHTSIMV